MFVVSVSQTAHLLYHIHFCLSRTFFIFWNKFFKQFLKWCVAHRSDLYILSQGFLFVNNYFCFFQNILNCLFTRNNFLRQLNKNTTFFQPCQHPFLFFLKIFRIPAWESWFIKLKQTAGEEYSYCMGDAWCMVRNNSLPDGAGFLIRFGRWFTASRANSHLRCSNSALGGSS